MKVTTGTTKLVIVLTRHPILGVLLTPYIADEGEENTITLVEQAFHASSAIIEKMNEAEQKTIETAACYTEKNLMKVYSKEKNGNDFLKKLSEKTLKEIVRPYIEKKLTEMITLIRTCNLPLYQKHSSSKLLYDHDAYLVTPYITEATFHFEADESQFRYSLQCAVNGQSTALQEKKPVIIITSSPAVLLLGTELMVFRDIEAARLIPFTNKAVVEVDAALTEKYLEKVVLPIIRHHDVTSKGLNIAEEQRTCEALLSLEEAVYEEPVLRLNFRYGDRTFTPDLRANTKFVYTLKEGEETAIRYFYRDAPTEHRLIAELKAAGLIHINESHFKLSEQAPEKTLSEWITTYRELIARSFRLTNSQNQATYCLDEIRMEQSRTEGVDWFELQMIVVIGDFRLPFTRFRKHILKGIREFTLPDNRIVLLPEEWFYKYADMFEYSEPSEKTIRLKRSLVGIVESIFDSGATEKRTNYIPKKDNKVPERLKATLRRYQKEGLDWLIHLHDLRFGGCLADDMGLGKTLQTLAFLLHIYDQGREETPEEHTPPALVTDEEGQFSLFGELNEENTLLPVENRSAGSEAAKRKPASLIVMPTSLLHNWKREAMRFTPLVVCQYTGMRPWKSRNFDRYHLILTSYGLMRNNIDVLKEYDFEYVVLDESQHIKNSDSQTFKAALQLRCHHRLVLTGTPVENSLKDLWAQFRFLQPELLGTESEFNKRFVIPVKQGDKRREEMLRRIIEPFILRRNKREVAPELPALTEEIIYCDMTETQNKIYQAEKNSLRNVLLEMKASEEKGRNFTMLNGILRLRQLSCHPKMVLDDFTGGSGKLEVVVSTFETLRSEGHKVLIFSSFVKHLELIAEALDKHEHPYAMLTGASTNRQEEIDRFNSSDAIGAFLISLKAGGVGLNLTRADYVFIIDPWWNPAAEMQAVARAHRIGQEKQVFAYRFITQGSIEEKIILLQEDKRKLAETFVTDSNPLETLTDKEWAELLDDTAPHP